MASIVHRAKDLGCIDQERCRYFNVELSRHGYKKNEPGNVYIDRPQLFIEAYELFKNRTQLYRYRICKNAPLTSRCNKSFLC